MTTFLNNARKRAHAAIYKHADAFYDFDTDGWQAGETPELQPGAECVVATPVGQYEVRFSWFAFSHAAVMADDRGDECRVFFGKRLRSETLTMAKAVDTEPYDVFFTVEKGFKRKLVLTRGS